MSRPLAVTLVLAVLAAAGLAGAQPGPAPTFPEGGATPIDQGSFRIYQSGQLLGAEVFKISGYGDSLLVTSRTYQVLPSGDTLRKDVAQVVGRMDFGLHNYHSKLTSGGHTLVRGLELGDTVFTSYRQFDGSGEGDVMVLPPGRVFVVDPKSFICFDVICRSIQGQVFDRRPLTLLILGQRDSMLDAAAVDQGTETIRWGGKPVTARKLAIGDANTTFTVWAAPKGGLLRLEQSESGLRVERDAPVAKPRPKTPPPGH
jgi:hypothetical protein